MRKRCFMAAVGVLLVAGAQGQEVRGTLPGPGAVPREAGSVDVKVVDKVTGSAIKGTKVWVQTTSLRRTQALVSAEGVAKVEWAARDMTVTVSITATGYVPLQGSFNVRLKKWEGVQEVKLEKGITIGGMVVDEGGKPVVGATVLLRGAMDPNTPAGRLSLAREGVVMGGAGPEGIRWRADVNYRTPMTTDAEGKWAFEGMGSDLSALSVAAYHVKYGTLGGRYIYELVRDEGALKDRTLKTVLKAGRLVKGRVVDPEGNGVAGVRVSMGTNLRAADMIPPLKTDAEGRFEVGCLPGETMVLTAVGSGFAPELTSFKMPDEEKEVTLALQPAKVLSGRVIGRDGVAVQNAVLAVQEWRGVGMLADEVIRTDDQGRFAWEGAPEDEVTMMVQAQGYTTAQVKLKAGDVNEVKLSGPILVSGSVVDEETGEAVKGIRLTPGLDFGEGGNVIWQGNVGGVQGLNVVDGKFEFRLMWSYPGWAVKVEAPGYAPVVSGPYLLKDGDRTLVLKMKKAEGVKGIVRDVEGKPVAGARVLAVTTTGNPLRLTNGEIAAYDSRDALIVKTDGEGRYELPAPGGKYVIIAISDEGFGKTQVLEKGGDVVMQKWGKVEGVVKVGARGAANVGVAANEEVTRAERGRGTLGEPRIYVINRVVTDGAGKFVFEKLVPGSYSVAKEQQIGPNGTMFVGGIHTEVKSGERASVQIGGKGRPVTGKIEVPPAVNEEGDLRLEQVMLATKVDYPRMDPPAEVALMPAKEQEAWQRKWMAGEEGKAFQQKIGEVVKNQKRYVGTIDKNGNWQVEDVEGGTYQVRATMSRVVQSERGTRMLSMGQIGAWGQVEVVVPEGMSEAAISAPAMIMRQVGMKVGEPATELKVKLAGEGGEGKAWSLGEMKGKYVLVNVWMMGSGFGEQLPGLKQVYERFGASGKLAMVGVSLDLSEEKLVEVKSLGGIGWSQGVVELGDIEGISGNWLMGPEGLWLIGPDGKVVATGAVPEIVAVLERVLAK